MPTFVTTDGREYTTDVPAEVTRLRMSRAYTEKGVEPIAIDDARFHPGDAKVNDVLAYLAEHPEDRARVVGEEKAGQARVSIVGNPGE